ncbi:MAG: hypothetical protein V1806_14575 [Pseudomonadota bacterium]
MEVYLDGKPLEGDLAGSTLQDMLQTLMDSGLGQDRTLSEVRINGQPFEEAKLGAATALQRDSIARLDVETMDARQVAVHFLGAAGQYLAAIVASVERVAELFRVSDESEASEHYLATLESLQLFMQVLQTTRDALGLDFEAITSDGVSLEQRLTRLAGLVQELLNAQEQEDWVLLADVLQYDLCDQLHEWRLLMPMLREQALS